jgi:hypothetical protein
MVPLPLPDWPWRLGFFLGSGFPSLLLVTKALIAHCITRDLTRREENGTVFACMRRVPEGRWHCSSLRFWIWQRDCFSSQWGVRSFLMKAGRLSGSILELVSRAVDDGEACLPDARGFLRKSQQSGRTVTSNSRQQRKAPCMNE